MSDAALLIDGQAVPTDATFGVVASATEEVFAQAPDAMVDALPGVLARHGLELDDVAARFGLKSTPPGA